MTTKTKKRFLTYGFSLLLVLGTLSLPAPTNAAVVVNTSIPFTIGVFIPCVPEPAILTGELHILITSTVDNNGGLHFKSHYQPQRLSGFGLVTGDKYQGTGVTQEHVNIHPGLAFEDTFINNFRMIGQGPGNNFLVHTTFHVTVNANGDVTANVLNTSVDCK